MGHPVMPFWLKDCSINSIHAYLEIKQFSKKIPSFVLSAQDKQYKTSMSAGEKHF